MILAREFGALLDKLMKRRHLTNKELAAKIPSPRVKSQPLDPSTISLARRAKGPVSDVLASQIADCFDPEDAIALKLAFDRDRTPASQKAPKPRGAAGDAFDLVAALFSQDERTELSSALYRVSELGWPKVKPWLDEMLEGLERARKAAKTGE